MSLPAEVVAAIALIPVGGEWWVDDCRQTYERLASDLIGWGLTPGDAEEVLTEAYWAAAEEYGGG